MKYDLTIRLRVGAKTVPEAARALLDLDLPGSLEYFCIDQSFEPSMNAVEAMPNIADIPPQPAPEPEPAPPPKGRKVKAEATVTPAKVPKEADREMLQEVATTLHKMKGAEHMKELLGTFGAARLSLVPDERVAEAHRIMTEEVDRAAN